MLMLSNLISK